MAENNDHIQGLHKHLTRLEDSFKEVKAEQFEISKNINHVNHRVDLIEVQIDAAQKREALVIGTINEKLEANTSLIKQLFTKFDDHATTEHEDRKRVLFWLMTTVVSVVGTVGMIVFGRVFGA